ncbi:hypothetical protein Q1695_004709 [Nippostrongylus brasiliensis]|nr:hypothetical protein Q1695_004709 [Nippostrongylus brasiliensis]
MTQRLPTLQNWSYKHGIGMRPKRPAAPSNYGTVEEGPKGDGGDSPVEVDNIASDPHAGGEPITALQAAWNVTNAIQGMFIVSLPIAVKVGEWWSVFAMMGVPYICYWTGVLLIECLYEKDKKVSFSYRCRVLSAWILQMGVGRSAHRAALYLYHLPAVGCGSSSELFSKHR